MVLVRLVPIQRLFLEMCVDLDLVIYGEDAIDSYPHLVATNNKSLAIDNAYANWYETEFDKKINQ